MSFFFMELYQHQWKYMENCWCISFLYHHMYMEKYEENWRKTVGKLEENWWKIGGKQEKIRIQEAGITAQRNFFVKRSRICCWIAAARMKRPKNLPGSSCWVPMGGTVFKRRRNSNKSFQIKEAINYNTNKTNKSLIMKIVHFWRGLSWF